MQKNTGYLLKKSRTGKINVILKVQIVLTVLDKEY